MHYRILFLASLLCVLPGMGQAQRPAAAGPDSLQLRGKHALGISTLSCLNGMLPLNYTQAINRRLAIRLSAGPTFANAFNDIQQGIYQDGKRSNTFAEGPWEPDVARDFDDDYHNETRRKYGAGFMAGAGLNYYFGGHALSGSYLGVLAQYRRYNSRALRVADIEQQNLSPELLYTESDPVAEWGKLTDVALSYGVARIFRRGFYYEFSAQAGVSYQRRHMQDLGQIYITNFKRGFVINGVQDYTVVRPYFNIDLRLGGWW